MSKPHHGFPSGYFKIRSRLTGKCIDIAGGDTNRRAKLHMWDCHNGYNQQWFVDHLGRICSRLNGLVLDIDGGNKSNGAKIHMWSPHGGSNQQWYVDSVGRIISRLNNKSISFDENNKGAAPLYMWDNYNGPSQRWYFERIGGDQTVQLVASYQGTQGVKRILASTIPPGAECTYQFWMKLNQFQGGSWKQIFCKSESPEKTKDRAPGLWIYPNKLKFHPRTNTTKKWNDGVKGDVAYDIPLRKWINVAVLFRGNQLEFYVDGRRVMTGKMDGTMNINARDLWIGNKNKHIELKSLEYTNYSLSKAQILKNMRTTDPRESKSEPKSALASDMSFGVHITKLTSNGSHPDCPPYRGRLGAQAWCGADQSTEFYLEAEFDQPYHIKAIMTQGRSNTNQWVTKYAVKYFENGQWTNHGNDFTGNTDRNSIQTNKVDFTTQRVRIYPLTWHGWPSLRVGFDGVSSNLSKCAKYKEDSVHGKTETIRKSSLDAYNQDCRKVSYYEYLEAVKREKSKYEELYGLLNKTKKDSKTSKIIADGLKSKISNLKSELKRAKLDLELAQHKKCPPVPTCLPVISPTTSSSKKPTINDFDIRTHQDFHKYVLASNVTPCKPCKPCTPSSTTSAPSFASGQESAQNSCQARFNKISDTGIVEMSGGGGVYLKLCQLTNGTNGTNDTNGSTCSSTAAAGADAGTDIGRVERAFQNDPYDIRKHKDFSKLMKDYVRKSKCAELIVKSKSKSTVGDIKNHPQYGALMDKYAYRTCSSEYRPCPVNELKKCIEIEKDIRKHPQYETIKKRLLDIKNHPDIKQYVHISDVKQMSRAMINKAIKDGKIPVGCDKDITKHPGYQALMTKYSPQNYVKREHLDRLKKELMTMAQKIVKAKSVLKEQQNAIGQLKQQVASCSSQTQQQEPRRSDLMKTLIPALMNRKCQQYFRAQEKSR